MKSRNMLTWMLWSAAAALSSPGHGHVLALSVTDPTQSVSQGIHGAHSHPGSVVEVKGPPQMDAAAAASGLTLFLGALALVRAGWASRRGARD